MDGFRVAERVGLGASVGMPKICFAVSLNPTLLPGQHGTGVEKFGTELNEALSRPG